MNLIMDPCLNNAVKNDSPIIISCRNNHKLIGKVRAFDRHCNLVLENVKELWTEDIKNNKGKNQKYFQGEIHFQNVLRGDSVIIILKA